MSGQGRSLAGSPCHPIIMQLSGWHRHLAGGFSGSAIGGFPLLLSSRWIPPSAGMTGGMSGQGRSLAGSPCHPITMQLSGWHRHLAGGFSGSAIGGFPLLLSSRWIPPSAGMTGGIGGRGTGRLAPVLTQSSPAVARFRISAWGTRRARAIPPRFQ